MWKKCLFGVIGMLGTITVSCVGWTTVEAYEFVQECTKYHTESLALRNDLTRQDQELYIVNGQLRELRADIVDIRKENTRLEVEIQKVRREYLFDMIQMISSVKSTVRTVDSSPPSGWGILQPTKSVRGVPKEQPLEMLEGEFEGRLRKEHNTVPDK